MPYKFNGKQPTFGNVTYISELAHVIGDVHIGNNSYIGHGAIVRGDFDCIEIGDGTAIEESVIIHAPPKEIHQIGKKVTIGHGIILHGKHIGYLAIIGMGAIVSNWSDVGEKAILVEGSVVRMNQVIPAKAVAVGNPAKVVRPVNEKDYEMWNSGQQIYIDHAKKCLTEGMDHV